MSKNYLDKLINVNELIEKFYKENPNNEELRHYANNLEKELGKLKRIIRDIRNKLSPIIMYNDRPGTEFTPFKTIHQESFERCENALRIIMQYEDEFL